MAAVGAATRRGQQPTSIAVEGRILKADGTVVELGTLAYHHRNPVKRLLAQRKVRGSGIVRSLLGRAPRVRER